jgi:hypothetical protein
MGELSFAETRFRRADRDASIVASFKAGRPTPSDPELGRPAHGAPFISIPWRAYKNSGLLGESDGSSKPSSQAFPARLRPETDGRTDNAKASEVAMPIERLNARW